MAQWGMFGIEHMAGLWSLLALVPFIILYLRRPRPKDETIPSLMFLLQENKRSKQFSFLQRFTSNILFYLQLFALLALSLAIAIPLISLPYDVTKENTILIIDASGSMQAKDGSSTRFEKAIDEAKSQLSGRNTIILAENNPLMVVEEESSDVANDVLGKLQPRATSTNLGDALLLAKDVLGEKPGRIVLISDFLVTEGPDVQVVRTTIASEDKVVDLVDVSSSVENTGIIKLDIGKYSSKVFVKNFDSEEKKRTIKINNNGKTVASTDITLPPYSIENFEFTTPAGTTTIELSPGDDFSLDDIAHLATPDKIKINVLLVTSLEEGDKLGNLELALRAAPDVNLNVVNPPVLTITNTGEKINPYEQDVIIFYRVDRNNILPGTFNDIEAFVKTGGAFIVAAQDDIGSLGLGSLSPVDFKSKITTPAKVCVLSITSVTKQFEKEACFTTISNYFAADLSGKSIPLASAGEQPIIAYKDLEGGKSAYYGLMDEYSDFRNLPSYPIFWNTLINYLVGTEDIKSYNYAAGSIATGDEQEVKTPTSTIKASKILLDEQGIYEFSGRKVAVNMLNEKESAVSVDSALTSISQRESLLSTGEQLHDFSLAFLLSVLAFLLVFTELIIVKVRGDV